MPEFEHNEAELQSFIMEIKKVKEVFPSLFAVENVDDLQMEENKFWEEYKALFKEVEAELNKSDVPAKDIVGDLKDRASGIAKRTQKAAAGMGNHNRQEFLAWINNRLGILVMNLDFLLTEDEEEEDDTLHKFKEVMSREKKQLLF